jgi:ATP-dependent helicase HepA
VPYRSIEIVFYAKKARLKADIDPLYSLQLRPLFTSKNSVVMSEIQTFHVGQRFISNSEAALGLGVVMAADARAVKILFPAVGEERTYAKSNAHVTRLVLGVGETVKHIDNFEIVIDEVIEQDNLLTYVGKRTDNSEIAHVVEVALDPQVKINQPEKR